MREIKFRAWRMGFGMTTPFTLGKLQDSEQFDFTDGSYLGANEFGLENEKTILMQFTGFRDKNGKEIYEGDIVLWLDGGWVSEHNPLVVAWENGAFECNSKDGWKRLFHNFDSDKFFEVIGNIYENPDLLKGD